MFRRNERMTTKIVFHPLEIYRIVVIGPSISGKKYNMLKKPAKIGKK